MKALRGRNTRGYTSPMAQAPTHCRAASSCRSSRGFRGSARSTRSPSSSAPRLATRSIKRGVKLFALDLAVRMMDLTTLEGADTPGKVAALCSKAMRPDPADLTVPAVAAVCVYPNLVPHALRARAREQRQGRLGCDRVSSRAASHGAEGRGGARVAELGADEIDMVIDRGAFLSGHYAKVYDEVERVKSQRPGAPEGDPRDRRARDTTTTCVAPTRDRRRCRLHQDLDPGRSSLRPLPVTLVMLEAIEGRLRRDRRGGSA